MAAMRLVNGRLVKRITLPVRNCNDCGACCMHMGTPPGYAAYYPVRDGKPSEEPAEWALESPDYERWKNLPLEVEAELRAYYRAVERGELRDRTDDLLSDEDFAAIKAALAIDPNAAVEEFRRRGRRVGHHPTPCLWFDEATRQCKHYEHRPETCRDAIEPGDEACRATRARFRIPLPEARS